MKYDPRTCCPPPAHPPRTEIPPGLGRLDRQTATFPHWRAAMLRAIGDHPELARWTADRPGDLGVMLLEFWAYVLDVTAFYDARLAERAFLPTAHEADVAAEIVALLGYAPRPALAASVRLALEARGADPVAVPARTGFRSEAFGSEPPQVFETLAATTIWPQRNGWTLAPYRIDSFDGTLRFRPGEAPQRGAVVAIAGGGDPLFAGEVAAVETEPHADGGRYQRVSFVAGTDLSALAGVPLSSMRAFVLGLKAPLSPLVTDGVSAVSGTVGGTALTMSAVSGSGGGNGWVILDALYPQIAKGSVAVLEVAGALQPVTVTASLRFLHSVTFGSGDAAVTQQIPASLIVFDYDDALSGRDMFLHVMPRPLGRPLRPAEPTRSLSDIVAGPALEPVVTALGEAPAAGAAIAVGQAQRGAMIDGTVTTDGEGGGSFVPAGDATPFAPALAAPVRLLGNVVTAVRGETVAREVLGSGDASRAFQTFKLQKKPLTWAADAAAVSGRSPQILLAVDGMYWSWVETLFGAGPGDRVFIVRMEPDGTARVQCGDGVTGGRFPSGVGNIVASYRFGAGAAKPPAGSIKQISRPVKDLARVAGPLAAFGGADAEDADAIRLSAPASMLSLGRAVSAADYLAIARAFNGVINAAVAQRWDAKKLQVAIDVSIIAGSGDPTGDLQQYLEERSVPGLPVTVTAASAVDVLLFDVAVEVAEGYVTETVLAEAHGALFDPATGLLAPARVPIGAPVFRSVIVAALHAVAGVAGVTAITLASGPMGKAMVPPAGGYFDFLAHGKVV